MSDNGHQQTGCHHARNARAYHVELTAGNNVNYYVEPMADNHVGHQHVQLRADNHVNFPQQ